MRSLGIIFVGYLIILPHVFFSWCDWIRPKGKKTPKERRNLQWDVWATSLLLTLLVALTVESFRNEFSLYWILYISAFVILLLFWSLKFVPGWEKG